MTWLYKFGFRKCASYLLSLSSKLTLSHALLPKAGPGTLHTPFLLCLASPCPHLPLGALQTSKLGEEGETCSIPLPSGILQAASGFCVPGPAMLHYLGSNRFFSWQHLNTVCSFVQHLEKQLYPTLHPQTPASHCFSVRGPDPIQAPPLSSDTKL